MNSLNHFEERILLLQDKASVVTGERRASASRQPADSGKVGTAGQTNYSAAMAGVVGLQKSAAKGLASSVILVSAIQPGIIRTEMVELLGPDVVERKLSDIPMTRFGESEEVGSVVPILEITGGRHA